MDQSVRCSHTGQPLVAYPHWKNGRFQLRATRCAVFLRSALALWTRLAVLFCIQREPRNWQGKTFLLAELCRLGRPMPRGKATKSTHLNHDSIASDRKQEGRESVRNQYPRAARSRRQTVCLLERPIACPVARRDHQLDHSWEAVADRAGLDAACLRDSKRASRSLPSRPTA